MLKKIIFLLLLSTILLAGCKSSNNLSSKTPITNDSVTVSPKVTTNTPSIDAKKSTNTNIIVKDKNTNSKLPPLTSNENMKTTDNVKSIVDSIDSVLSSQDEAKELDLN